MCWLNFLSILQLGGYLGSISGTNISIVRAYPSSMLVILTRIPGLDMSVTPMKQSWMTSTSLSHTVSYSSISKRVMTCATVR